MKDAGIVIKRKSDRAKELAKQHGLELLVDPKLPANGLPWGRVLFVSDGVSVPWDLLGAGFHFLERWDAAAPLWRYGVLAKHVGTTAERRRTAKLCVDLRLILYEPALLFVSATDAGRALVEAWLEEQQHGTEYRLAFLRAFHLVKPKLCPLPRSWLAEARPEAQSASRRRHNMPPVRMVKIEVAPGVFVKGKPGTEDEVKQLYRKRRRP